MKEYDEQVRKTNILSKNRVKPQKSQTAPLKPFRKEMKTAGKRRFFNLIGLVIIVLLGIIIYSNSFRCTFHFDDFKTIVQNTKIQNIYDFGSWWSYSPTRPVSIFTFALNYHFFKLDVWYYHLVNLIIHLVNAGLVWGLTLLIFSSPAVRDNPVAKHKKIIALFTALFFVSHPLATQSVTYIVQRMTSLAALFYLLSLTLYIKARIYDKNKKFNCLLYAGAWLSAILAMLTKENAFTLPFMIILFELFFMRTKYRSGYLVNFRTIIMILALISILIIIPFANPTGVFKPIPPSLTQGGTQVITPLNYFLTQPVVIAKYILLLFVPVNQNVDYDFPLSESFWEPLTVLCFLFLLSLLVLAVILFKRNRVLSFGIFWFFMTLSVESGFIPISDVIFEHRTYLPSFGFFLILSSILFMLPRNIKTNIIVSGCVVVTIIYSALTYDRNKIWKDELTLWEDVVLKSPGKARPYINRGSAYSLLGQWDKALADYSRGIELSPNYLDALYNRGYVYGKLGQWEKASADYSRAIEISPRYIPAYSNRGNTYAKMGLWDKAINDYSEAIGMDPAYIMAYYNRGLAWYNLQEWENALKDFSMAARLDTGYTDAYYNRGLTYGNLDQWDKAINDFSKVVELDPGNATAFNNLGGAYSQMKQWDKSITFYTSAIELNPAYARAYNNRGYAYERLGQYDNARADYDRAASLDPEMAVAGK